MAKKFLPLTAVATMLALFTSNLAEAENPKAAELREIINSNHYYVEYEEIGRAHV